MLFICGFFTWDWLNVFPNKTIRRQEIVDPQGHRGGRLSAVPLELPNPSLLRFDVMPRRKCASITAERPALLAPLSQHGIRVPQGGARCRRNRFLTVAIIPLSRRSDFGLEH